MSLSNDFVKAEDAYRGDRFEQEKVERVGLFRKSATAVLVTGVALAACGGPIDNPAAMNPSPSNLIVELAPVGSPSISALRGYETPEMFPVVANQTLRIDGYEAPEMWPEAEKPVYVEPSSGPR